MSHSFDESLLRPVRLVTRRLGRRIRAPMLVFASVAISLLLCEAIVRTSFPQQLIILRPDIWEPIVGPGWRLRPNLDTTINTGEGDVKLSTDSRGYRIGEHGDVKGEISVLVLGDSYMEALQVEYEESLAGLIEADLEACTEKTVRSYNTGVSDWGPSQYLIAAHRAFADLPIDVVVLAIFLGNDYEKQRTRSFLPRKPHETHRIRLPRSVDFKEWVDAVLYPLNDWLERSSQLFQLAKYANQALLLRLGLSARTPPIPLIPSPELERSWANAAEDVADIVRLAEHHGVSTLVVLLPADYQVDPEAYHLLSFGFNLDPATLHRTLPQQTLRPMLSDRGIEAIDVLPPLELANHSGLRVYGHVDEHFTARGHAIAYATMRGALLATLHVPLSERCVAARP